MTTEEKRCPFCRRLWNEAESGVCSSCGGREQVYSDSQRFLEMTPLLRFGRSVALLGLLAGLMIWVTERGFQYVSSTTEPFHFTWVTIGFIGVFGAIAIEVMVRQIRHGEHDPEQDLAEIFSVLCSGKGSDCQTTREQTTVISNQIEGER